MNYPNRIALLCAASCLVALSACTSGTVKETLGLSRRPPDEFTVLPRPALSVPPQFNLRPPATPGDDSTSGATPASTQAESLVMGSGKGGKGETFKVKDAAASTSPAASAAAAPAKKSVGASNAESQFLNNAGADKANPQVRAEIAKDHMVGQADEEDDGGSWWNPFEGSTKKKEPIVNPGKETDRLKTNKAAGKPVTEGDTPQDKARDRGVLGRILGDD